MRSTRLWMMLVLFLMLPISVFGAGGSCPSGANYLSLSNPTGAKVALSAFGITSCFYVAANGSDSNNGTSESTPWLHAPGMPNCSANCLTEQNAPPAAGTGFIFRGGDTWHFGNSSASPYAGGGWVWYGWSGTSGHYIYIGVDPGWYSGSSWARPILNADNPTSTSAVASCAYQVAANSGLQGFANRIAEITANYFIFDNFELTGLCWNTNGGGVGGVYLEDVGTSAGNGNVGYVQNNYIHGWTHTTAGGQAGGAGLYDYNQNFGEIWRFNVIDGSDSDVLGLNALGENDAGYDIEYNVIRNTGGCNIFQAGHIFHDNLFEYIYQLNDNSCHSDMAFFGGEWAGGTSDPNVFYNNIVRDVAPNGNDSQSPGYWGGYIMLHDTPPNQPDYWFNNVLHDVNGTEADGSCDNAESQNQCDRVILFNNTFEGLDQGGTWYAPWGNTNATWTTPETSVNNHWVTDKGSGPSAVFTDPSVVTESTAVYQTLSVANGQGYTSANDFSPTSANGATVTASGTNETNGYCADSVLNNAAAEAACVQGITGVSYNPTNHTVLYPAFTPVGRPATGAWNVGAYQYQQGQQVDPPTNLQATPQ
jgi:hypothetical protein